MPIKIALVGASGRVGQLIIEVISEFPELEISAALVSDSSRFLGKICHGAVTYSSDLESGIKGSDAVIDFSTPHGSVQACQYAALWSKPVLVATTGHTEQERASLSESSTKIPILLAPNTSIGIFALRELSLHAAKLLAEFDIEIAETHHRMKKDAPSGTAVMLADALCEQTDRVQNRKRSISQEMRQVREIGIASFRGGDVLGEHVVSFHGMGETLELIHRVRDRKIFARGALRLVGMLPGLSPGLLDLATLYKLSPD